MLRQRITDFGNVLLGIGILLAALALPIVFIEGGIWASENLLRPLILIGWLALAIDIIFLLPLSIFRRLRGVTGSVIFFTSYVFGLVTWLTGFITVYAIWGIWPVVVGILFIGGGVVPIALLATAIKGFWEPFFELLTIFILTFGSRLVGVYIASKAPN